MLGYWHYELDERQWLLSIAAKAEHQLRRAERWERELADVEAGGGSPRDVEDKLADFVRREQFARSERRIIRTCQERFGGELEAPEEAPTPRAYALAWALAILINAYFAYFLVAMGSGLGRRESKLWLFDCGFSLALYFLIIKPGVIAIFFVLIPATVKNHVATHMDPLKSAAFPYEATLPGSATFYVLLRRPDLRHTPIGRQINTLAGGNADVADGAIEDVVDDQRIDEQLADVSRAKKVLISLLGVFLAMQEDVQSAILEEIFAFAPLIFGPAVSALPFAITEGGGRGSTGTALVLGAMVLAGALGVALVNACACLRGWAGGGTQAKLRRLETERDLLRTKSSAHFKRSSLAWLG